MMYISMFWHNSVAKSTQLSPSCRQDSGSLLCCWGQHTYWYNRLIFATFRGTSIHTHKWWRTIIRKVTFSNRAWLKIFYCRFFLIFFILNWPTGSCRRTRACFFSLVMTPLKLLSRQNREFIVNIVKLEICLRKLEMIVLLVANSWFGFLWFRIYS